MRNSTERDLAERDLEYRRETQIARDNANAASSYALGIAIISLVGVVFAIFFLNQRTPAPTQAPTQAPVQQQQPDVNITVPAPAAPETAPVAPAPNTQPRDLPQQPVLPEPAPAQP